MKLQIFHFLVLEDNKWNDFKQLIDSILKKEFNLIFVLIAFLVIEISY